jgi:hypothetical protein
MNPKQREELLNLVTEFLIDADHLYHVKKYSLKAYTNPKSTKIPITFQAQSQTEGDEEEWLDNLTIDYYKQEILEECGGYNMEDDFVVLGCELKTFKGINEIRYHYNQELSDELNNQFARV